MNSLRTRICWPLTGNATQRWHYISSWFYICTLHSMFTFSPVHIPLSNLFTFFLLSVSFIFSLFLFCFYSFLFFSPVCYSLYHLHSCFLCILLFLVFKTFQFLARVLLYSPRATFMAMCQGRGGAPNNDSQFPHSFLPLKWIYMLLLYSRVRSYMNLDRFLLNIATCLYPPLIQDHAIDVLSVKTLENQWCSVQITVCAWV